MDEIYKTPAAVDPEDAVPAQGRTPVGQVGEPDPSAKAPEVDSHASGSSIVDGEEHAVDPRSIVVSRLVAALWIAGVAAINFLGITIGWALGGVATWIYLLLLLAWGAITGCALLLGYKWPELHHRHLRYRVDESGVRIRSGVLWRKVVSIPTSRVQHTDVSQGPVQRHYEIATLTVFTAGTEGASIALSGLEHGLAQRLRDHLLPDHAAR